LTAFFVAPWAASVRADRPCGPRLTPPVRGIHPIQRLCVLVAGGSVRAHPDIQPLGAGPMRALGAETGVGDQGHQGR
jgi:hypothetical protein